MSGKLNLGNKFNSANSNSLENSFDSLFGEPTPKNSSGEEISIKLIKPFGFYDKERASLHHFRPYSDEKMIRLVQDIKEHGIISPLIVRQRATGEYEILAGHNRYRAAHEANFQKVPCIVKNVDDDEAIIIMTTTNLNQRDELLPSEKAFAYKEQLDAMKRQGKRTDLSSSQFETKSRTDEVIANAAGESRAQVQRYIRLTKLIPELLVMVDSNEIAIGVGENLSYLIEDTQKDVFDIINGDKIKISISLSETLKARCKNRQCKKQEIIDILSPAPTAITDKPIKISIQNSTYKKYFPDKKPKEVEQELLRILDEHFSSTNN